MNSEEKNVKYVSGEEVLSYIIKTSQFNTNDKESNKKIIKMLEYTLLKRDKWGTSSHININ